MKLISEEVASAEYLIEEKNGKKEYKIKGVFLQSNIKNRNGRVYPREILVREVNRYTKEVVLTGRGNYGLKPGEEKIKDVVGNILLDSDSNVTKYNLVIEAHKESGYN